MKVPLSWLGEYVTLPPEPQLLVERLTMAGLEAAEVKVFGKPVPPGLRVKPEDQTPVWESEKLVVAQVVEITKHPNADTLKLVKLDYGASELKTVVTGAPNIAPGQSGMKVILGLRGTRYFAQDKAGKKTVLTLEPKALRGIENDAMCMSNFELGIAEDHEGIIILDHDDPPPGTPAVNVLGEIVIDLDVLPNMARCLALLGIAREVAALTGAAVRYPDVSINWASDSAQNHVAVAIANPQLCRRYAAMLIRNVSVSPAPRWMRTRLHYAGMRPINNVVDVTNYVMLEWGQPLHAFDYDVLVQRAGSRTPTITVRLARDGEKLTTLDGQRRDLAPHHLVIADDLGPIALAGVMGGAETEVTAQTRNVLLESAAFDFVTIRRTSRQLTLFSEASTRFSRGIHPEQVRPAILRAAHLLQQCAQGQVLSGVVDQYPAPLPHQVIDFPAAEIRRILGFDIPKSDVERVLKALEFQVEPQAEGWRVTTPPHRLDIQVGPADLVEEIARITGYDKLPDRLLPVELPPPANTPALDNQEQIRNLLAGLGLQETITYALTSREQELKLITSPYVDSYTSETANDHRVYVTLLNPISPERSVMRRTLLPGLLEVLALNLPWSESVALFELGPVYLPRDGSLLPDEPLRLGVVLAGGRSLSGWDQPQGQKSAMFDFYDLKGILESLLEGLHIKGPTYRAPRARQHLHPGRSAEVFIGEKCLGHMGELHPKVASAFRLEGRPVQVAELDVEAMIAAIPERFAYRPVSSFPPAKRDLAVIVPQSTPAEAVFAEIRAAGGDLLREATLFDVYTGESIPAGTKSLAFALLYQAPDRTLTDKEIDKAHQRIEGRLRHVLKGQIRGKD